MRKKLGFGKSKCWMAQKRLNNLLNIYAKVMFFMFSLLLIDNIKELNKFYNYYVRILRKSFFMLSRKYNLLNTYIKNCHNYKKYKCCLKELPGIFEYP